MFLDVDIGLPPPFFGDFRPLINNIRSTTEVLFVYVL